MGEEDPLGATRQACPAAQLISTEACWLAATHAASLPSGEIPLALFSFNVGIELGQLAFVALMSGAGWLVVRWLARRPAWIMLGPAYVMGSLSALWCLERTVVLILGR